MVKEGRMATLSVSDHKEVAQGTLRSLIRSSGMTITEFAEVSKEFEKKSNPEPLSNIKEAPDDNPKTR